LKSQYNDALVPYGKSSRNRRDGLRGVGGKSAEMESADIAIAEENIKIMWGKLNEVDFGGR